MSEEHPDQVKYGMRIECQVMSRVVGYVTSVRDWNDGKKQEFAERKVYGVPSSKQLEEEDNGHPRS